jgi:MATE family multidrug resistance protein
MQVGVLLQRCMAIMFAISIPTIFLWFYAEQLLLMVGQQPKVSKMAGDFCKWSVPGLWGLFMCMSLRQSLSHWPRSYCDIVG